MQKPSGLSTSQTQITQRKLIDMEFDPNANFYPPSQQFKKNSKPKAVWNSDAHKVFVDLCCEQMSKGSKIGTFFSRDGWNKICFEFAQKTGLNYDKKQLKNHWDSTKQDWKVWYKLMTSNTGLGWDNIKNTASASDEWWDEYLKANPEAAKFRYKGFENSEELTSLFQEGYATGKNTWAPSEGSLPKDFSGPYETQPSQNVDHVDSDVEVQVEEPNKGTKSNQTKNGAGETSGSRHRKRARDLTYEIPPPERPRKVSAAAKMDKYLSRICETVEAMGAKSEKTMQECVNILNEMSEVPKGSDLYLFACRSFLKKGTKRFIYRFREFRFTVLVAAK